MGARQARRKEGGGVKHFVLIQEPRRKGVYIKCPGIDECLHVVERESE